MDISLYFSFVFASLLLIVIPGPNLLVIISTSISNGKVRGLQTVCGTSTAMAIQLLIAALGTSWFVVSLSQGFEILRWLGISYLIYLGVKQLSLLFVDNKPETNASHSGTFLRGFVVSLTNPKTVFFFSAFLPQFIADQGDYVQQLFILSLTFWVLATLIDTIYALTAGAAAKYLGERAIRASLFGTGSLLLGAGVWLALLKRN